MFFSISFVPDSFSRRVKLMDSVRNREMEAVTIEFKWNKIKGKKQHKRDVTHSFSRNAQQDISSNYFRCQEQFISNFSLFFHLILL